MNTPRTTINRKLDYVPTRYNDQDPNRDSNCKFSRPRRHTNEIKKKKDYLRAVDDLPSYSIE